MQQEVPPPPPLHPPPPPGPSPSPSHHSYGFYQQSPQQQRRQLQLQKIASPKHKLSVFNHVNQIQNRLSFSNNSNAQNIYPPSPSPSPLFDLSSASPSSVSSVSSP
eukprot:266590_1